MVRKRQKKKSVELLEFIAKNPGMTIEEISESLKWTRRSVKLILGKLEKTGEISTRYFPAVIKEASETQSAVDREIAFGKDRLEKMLLRLQKEANEAFERCVEAKMAKDENLASVYANQCAEIRKLINTVVASEGILSRMGLAMESLRLNLRRKDYPKT